MVGYGFYYDNNNIHSFIQQSLFYIYYNKLTDDDIIDNNNNTINTKYILLVDDDEDTIFTFDLYLKSIGYTIISFVNPVEALDYFNKNIADCSLVITDYGMPQMSGIDLIKKIREKDQNYTKKIILISATIKGDILTDYYDELSNLKVNTILEKPMSLEILKNEIRRKLLELKNN